MSRVSVCAFLRDLTADPRDSQNGHSTERVKTTIGADSDTTAHCDRSTTHRQEEGVIMARRPDTSESSKPAGWFSRRHQTNEAHVTSVARYQAKSGKEARIIRAQQRKEAAEKTS